MFKKLDRSFDTVLSGLGMCGVGIMMCLSAFVSFHAILRGGFNISMAGLFDLSLYALLIFPFITMAYTLRENKHIAVDVFTSRLSERARISLEGGVYLLSLIFPIILGWKAGEWAYEAFVSRAGMLATWSVPKGIFILIIAFGCFLLSLQIIRKLVHIIRLLTSSTVSEQVPYTGLRANPLVYMSLVIIGFIICLGLFKYWSPVGSIIILTLFLLFCGMPVFLTLGLVGCLGIYLMVGSTGLMQIPIIVFQSMFSFPLTCLPLFVLGGLILEQGKIVERIFVFFEVWAGRFTPSLLIAAIATGAVFCSISGSSVAATAVIGAIAIPALVSRGFRRSLSCGVVAGATVGTIIPPSVSFVVYGVITDESIAQLFMAGLIPGAVLFGFYFLFVTILSIVNKKSLFENGEIPSHISTRQISWKERFIALRNAAPGLLTPVIVLGGIYAGIFTPTEAAGILVVLGIIICAFITRTLKWRDMLRATLQSAQFSSMILCLMFGAHIFSSLVVQLRLVSGLGAWVESMGLGANGVLGLMFIVIFILGMFVNATPILVMTAPIFYPMAMAVGIDGLWLGVFYILCLEMSGFTPPVGMMLFAIRGVTDIPLGTIMKGCFPFILIIALTLVILFIFPQLVTWLPSTMSN